jgi:hypothetical protein
VVSLPAKTLAPFMYANVHAALRLVSFYYLAIKRPIVSSIAALAMTRLFCAQEPRQALEPKAKTS